MNGDLSHPFPLGAENDVAHPFGLGAETGPIDFGPKRANRRDDVTGDKPRLFPFGNREWSATIAQFKQPQPGSIRGKDGQTYMIEAGDHPILAQVRSDGKITRAAIIFNVADADGRPKALARFIRPTEIDALSRAGGVKLEPGVDLGLAPKRTQTATTADDAEKKQHVSRGLHR